MASIINASNTSGLVFTSDMSGVLQLQQNGVALPALSVAPTFSAYTTTAQSIPNSTFTKIQLNLENFDTNSNFDSTTNYRFTPTVAGYYQINGNIALGGAASGYCQISIYKNGSAYQSGSGIPNNTSVGGMMQISSVVYLNGSTDYVELWGWQNSGGSLSLSNSTGFNTLSGCLVRGA